MKKLITICLLLIIMIGAGFIGLVLITPAPPVPPVIPPTPKTDAVALSLMDGNQNIILADKEGELRVYPASTTKILTCIIALEDGADKLKGDAVISKRAMSQDGTNLGLRSDLPLSLHEVLYGMMLVSGNDAAVSVAETVGGSYENFVAMMNQKAQSIGARDSHFANPNGLTDSNHYVTANDMVKIAAYAMRNDSFREIVKRQTYPMTYRNGLWREVENRNELLGRYEGVNGVKTGMTEAAGDCLVASAERNGHLLVVALFNDANRWEDAKAWLDYGFTVVAEEERYKAELAAEPALYKWVNQVTGKEPHD